MRETKSRMCLASRTLCEMRGDGWRVTDDDGTAVANTVRAGRRTVPRSRATATCHFRHPSSASVPCDYYFVFCAVLLKYFAEEI